MPTYSDLPQRLVNQVGIVWRNGADVIANSYPGQYVKSIYTVPSLGFIANNIKRLIFQEQNQIFSEIEAQEGITFAKDDGLYFQEDSIHIALHRDPNKLAIWISYENETSDQTYSQDTKARFRIYITPGAGNPDDTTYLSSAYAQAIANLFTVIRAEELVFGYPVNVATSRKRQYQPDIKITSIRAINPDRVSGETSDSIPPIAEFSFTLEIKPQYNKP